MIEKVSKLLETIHTSKEVFDAEGKSYELNSAISKAEGEFIFNLIKEHNCKTTIEVGCAYGISSLYICAALAENNANKDCHHTILDPNYRTQWNGIGEANLQRADIDYFELQTEFSELALPKLLSEEKKYDLIFIDGFHTMDQTLLDIYYGNRLLKVGGIMVIDDVLIEPVNKAVRYLSNYPAYKNIGGARVSKNIWKVYNLIIRGINLFSYLIPLRKRLFSPEVINYSKFKEINFSTMLAFQKTSEDTRSWDWYEPF